jgi:hypothetical protein
MDEKNRQKIWDYAKIAFIFIILLFSIYSILKSYGAGAWWLYVTLVLTALVIIWFAGTAYKAWKTDRALHPDKRERPE